MSCATRSRLTIEAETIATAELKTGGDRESVAAKDVFNKHVNDRYSRMLTDQ